MSEWTVVNRSTTKRKVAKRRPTDRQAPQKAEQEEEEEEVSAELVVSQLSSCGQHLPSSQFYDNLVRAWKNCPDMDESSRHVVDEIVCYGIGNFCQKSSHFSGPLWQLALALEWKSLCCVPKRSVRMVYYDPLVTSLERRLLQDHYQIKVLSCNERGIRSLEDTTTTTTTLFFMPHCPKGLYENVLWANWNRLKRDPRALCIVGNSLVTYVERAADSATSKATSPSCLERIQPFVHEQIVAYSKQDVRDMPGHFEAAFNDTYLTWFVSTGGLDWPERPLEPSPDGQNEVL